MNLLANRSIEYEEILNNLDFTDMLKDFKDQPIDGEFLLDLVSPILIGGMGICHAGDQKVASWAAETSYINHPAIYINPEMRKALHASTAIEYRNKHEFSIQALSGIVSINGIQIQDDHILHPIEHGDVVTFQAEGQLSYLVNRSDIKKPELIALDPIRAKFFSEVQRLTSLKDKSSEQIQVSIENQQRIVQIYVNQVKTLLLGQPIPDADFIQQVREPIIDIGQRTLNFHGADLKSFSHKASSTHYLLFDTISDEFPIFSCTRRGDGVERCKKGTAIPSGHVLIVPKNTTEELPLVGSKDYEYFLVNATAANTQLIALDSNSAVNICFKLRQADWLLEHTDATVIDNEMIKNYINSVKEITGNSTGNRIIKFIRRITRI